MIKKRKWSKRNLNEQDFNTMLGILKAEKIIVEWNVVKEKIRFVYDPQEADSTYNESHISMIWWYELSYASVRRRFNMSRSQWDRFMHYVCTLEAIE